MKIPVGYMDRRREGDTVLRQTQLVLLHLLHVIDRICSENGIRYWLAWGSCLGAMRHDGFIPWDDDLDIGLSVKDFKRLIKLLPRELPEDARLQVPADCPKVAIPFPKVRDCSSFLFESRPDISTADPSGIYIDISHSSRFPRFRRRCRISSTLSADRRIIATTSSSTRARVRCGAPSGACRWRRRVVA